MAFTPHALPSGHPDTAGLFPEFEHFEAFAGKSLISDFGELVKRFGQEARLDGTYFFCKQDSVTAIATLIQGLTNLTLKVNLLYHMKAAVSGSTLSSREYCRSKQDHASSWGQVSRSMAMF